MVYKSSSVVRFNNEPPSKTYTFSFLHIHRSRDGSLKLSDGLCVAKTASYSDPLVRCSISICFYIATVCRSVPFCCQ